MARKRNTKGEGGVRKRADGTYEARWTAGYDPGTGKQIRKSVYGSTAAEASRKKVDAIAAYNHNNYFEPSRITVGEWLDFWLDEYKTDDIKPSTLAKYRIDIENHIKPALGAVRLADLRKPAVQQFINRLKRKSNLSAKSTRNTFTVLKSALRQAVEADYIAVNPADGCNLPRLEKKEIRPLTEAEIPKFINAVCGTRYELLYLITLFTGMREGEALGLSWDEVDLQKGILTIKQQLQKEKQIGGQYVLVETKTSKSRSVALPFMVIKFFQRRKAEQCTHQLAAGGAWDNKWNLVFTNELGRHLAFSTVWKDFKKYAIAIERPDLRFHDLRHSYVVAARTAGDDWKTIQESLGHHSASFTMDIYGHLTEQMKRDAADRMDTFMRGISGL